MRPAPGALALLLPLLAACVDFVDPVGLGLARDARIEVAFALADDPRRAACPGPAMLPADSVVLCVQATVLPGLTRLGERRRVLDDTLRAMGVPLTPLESSDSLLRYQRRFTLPLRSLERIPITATLPRIEGVEVRSRDVRWFAVGRADPDTLARAAGAGVRLRLDLPEGVSTPAPDFQFWSVNVSGDTTTVGYDASGIPRAGYDFPGEVLAPLGGPRLLGDLLWQRQYAPPGEDVQIIVRLSERLSWTILTR